MQIMVLYIVIDHNWLYKNKSLVWNNMEENNIFYTFYVIIICVSFVGDHYLIHFKGTKRGTRLWAGHVDECCIKRVPILHNAKD